MDWQSLTRGQAIHALHNSKPVYDRNGERGFIIEINANGFRWQRASDGQTSTFPGIKKCDWLSFSRPDTDKR